MFEKWADKLKEKAQVREEEEITFKPFDDEVATEVNAPADKAEANAEEAQGASLSASGAENNIELKVVRPEAFADVSTIADHLLDGRTVVLNMEAMDAAAGRRMLDFLNGVTYSLNGEIKMVAQGTYILTPKNVDVSDN